MKYNQLLYNPISLNILRPGLLCHINWIWEFCSAANCLTFLLPAPEQIPNHITREQIKTRFLFSINIFNENYGHTYIEDKLQKKEKGSLPISGRKIWNLLGNSEICCKFQTNILNWLHFILFLISTFVLVVILSSCLWRFF